MLPKLQTRLTLDASVRKATNLTSRFTAQDLASIGIEVYDGYTRDKFSRRKWESRMEAAMDLAMQVQKDKSFPWPGCSNVVFPLVTIAALQFSSRSYAALIPGVDVVKYRVTGPDEDEKLKQRADRIGRHMSWQVLEEDTAWEEGQDRLLINDSIVGTAFKKSYFSSKVNHNVSELVMARDLVIDYWAKSVPDAARKTQIIPLHRNDVHSNCVTGVFKDVRKEEWFNSVPAQPAATNEEANKDNRQGVTPPPAADRNTPFRTLEQHCLMDFDQDGYAEPYVITIEESSKQVLRIVARWEREGDIEYDPNSKRIIRIQAFEYFTKYGFIPSPDGGIYDVGFGILLGPLNESVNSGINQLLDSGTQYNSNGGFFGRGVRFRGGVYTFAPFQWVRVDSTGKDLKDNMVPFQTREPSDVMFKLLGLLIEYTERIAGTTDPMVGVSPGQNTPAETSRNTLEQGMKVYGGIYKRIWRSEKEEFKKLHQLNALFLPLKVRFGNKGSYVTREDYLSDPDLVIPAADPTVVSDSTKVQQATMMLEASEKIAGFAKDEVVRNWLRALKIEAIDKYFPGSDKTGPLPNPKMQVEQMKMQLGMEKLKLERVEFMTNFLEQKKKTQADINKINAEIIKLLAEVQTEKVQTRIAAFESIVAALQAHSEMLSNNIDMMSKLNGGEEDGDQGTRDKGGVGKLASGPGNGAGVQIPQAQPTGANGAMGG